MTQDQKRIAIAEARGLQVTPEGTTDEFGGVYMRDVCVAPGSREEVKLPDYFHDLNACHEMEKVLTTEQRWAYTDRLVPKDETRIPYDECWLLLHATAAQRAEAFGLTLGLWKEGEG